MNKRQYAAVTALVSMIIANGVLIPAANASTSVDTRDAYTHDASINYSASDWMANINNNTRLSELSIPGTHDTMATGPGGDTTQTQSMDLKTQLNSGIRFIDIRLLKKPNDEQLYLHHGPVFLNATVDDVMNTISEFLTAHPTETVLMRVKQEWSDEPNDQFSATLRSHLQPYNDQLWVNDGQGVQTNLHNTRSKLVLLNEIPGLPWGMAYGESMTIQDAYHLTNEWDLYRKWTDVKNHIEEAQTGDRYPLYINYLSGSGGTFPYFVASGKTSPETKAPRLSTGLTTPAFKNSYPDFPRTSCFITSCTISFEGTNRLTTDYIKQSQLNFTGIIVADFPGPALIDAVITANPW
jgi:hypothetical protein